jgi:hypothetical protein
VVEGVGDGHLAATVLNELSRLEGEGFGGGVFVMQLVNPRERASLTLE